jgi:hypothetical protein
MTQVMWPTKDFGENENKNHSDEESGLLSGTTDTGITNDTDGETSGETSKTDRETGTELDETSVQGLLLGKLVGDQDGNDETVNGNDTSHNDGNNVWRHVSGWAVILMMEEVHADRIVDRIAAHILQPNLLRRINVLLTIKSGLSTPMAEIPTPALAVP